MEKKHVPIHNCVWKLPKQIALGTGVGIRYDMDILVFRLDFGIPLHLPYDTDRSGYYNVTGAFLQESGNTFLLSVTRSNTNFLYDFSENERYLSCWIQLKKVL